MPTSKFSTRWPVTVEHECWKCVYDCEISGEINHGSKGDSITPGEDPFIESGSFKMLVCGITDHRFAGITTNADCTVILSGAVTRKQAGEWVREQMRPHEVLDLQELLIERWERDSRFRLGAL